METGIGGPGERWAGEHGARRGKFVKPGARPTRGGRPTWRIALGAAALLGWAVRDRRLGAIGGWPVRSRQHVVPGRCLTTTGADGQMTAQVRKWSAGRGWFSFATGGPLVTGAVLIALPGRRSAEPDGAALPVESRGLGARPALTPQGRRKHAPRCAWPWL